MKYRIICTAALSLCLLSGCSSTIENPAAVPFSSKEVAGMPYEDVLSALEQAGFTQIQSEPITTRSTTEAGTVESLVIREKSSFSQGKEWESDTPVVLTHYQLEQLEVTGEIKVEGEDGKPEFSFVTNLPDGLKVKMTLLDDNYYNEQQEVEIEDGTATSEPFLLENELPLRGDYTLTVVMEPADQSFWSTGTIGSSGEYLAGDLIQQNSVNQTNYVFLEYAYTSPLAAYTADEIKELALNIDAKLMGLCMTAEEEYQSLFSNISNGTFTDLDAYNAAKNLKTVIESCYLLMPEVDETGILEFDSYAEAVSNYLFAMRSVADSCLTYLDDPKTSNLSDVQTNVEIVNAQLYEVASTRIAYMTAAGFTEEERTEIFNAGIR